MLTLFSPAKINLFLRVINKRPDGFHNISSLFQAIDLGDILTFQLHHEDVLTCSDSTLPTDSTNLILQAVNLFRRKTGSNLFFKIHLEKKIPVEAGLGGGSSNAATTLWALNILSKLGLTSSTLKEWGAEIGSDVAFFLSTCTAYCTGRGEKIKEIAPLSSCNVYIVKPSTGLSTPAVFKQLKASTAEKQQADTDFEQILCNKISYFNDLEKPAFKINPDLYFLKQQLINKGFKTVLMSGSGSSFFCIGEGELKSEENLYIYTAKFINRKVNEWYIISSESKKQRYFEN